MRKNKDHQDRLANEKRVEPSEEIISGRREHLFISHVADRSLKQTEI